MRRDSDRTALVLHSKAFMGRQVVRDLRERGWRVHPVRFAGGSRRGGRPRIEGVEGEALPRGADLLVSSIARTSDVGWRRRFIRENVDPVLACIDAVEELDVGRLVHLSTTDVYGLGDFQGEAEDQLSLPSPRNPYPGSALEAERALLRGLQRERFTILRPGAVWGAADTELVVRVQAFLARSSRVPFVGRWKGANEWPFVHVANVAAAVRAAAGDLQSRGQAINLVDHERMSIRTFFRSVSEAAFPGRGMREIAIPYGLLAGYAGMNTAFSNLLNLDRPVLDPSLYALRSLRSNLAFGNRRFLDLVGRHSIELVSREDGFRQLAADLSPPTATSGAETIESRNHRADSIRASTEGHSDARRAHS